MIKELCNKLKEKRKELGYSIEYVVEKTKLHPSMIRDIEEGNLANENPTYIRGFIKIYAAFLKVDRGSSLEEISTQEPRVRKKEPKVRKIDKSIIFNRIGSIIGNVMKKISPEIRKKIILVLAGIALLWVLFIVSGFVVGKITKFFTAPAKSTQEVQRKEVPEAAVALPQGEELVATVSAKKNCFLRVVVDGDLLFEGVLRKGARETWRGDKEIELKIRDGSAITLEVNGRSIPTLTSLRKPIKSLKITPSGIVVDK